MADTTTSALSQSISQDALDRLVRTDLLIDGSWESSLEGARFAVTNPANGETLANVSNAVASDIERAVAAAQHAQIAWADLVAPERALYLRKWFELIIEQKENLARILTLEQGKPIKEALGEIEYGAAYIDWFSGEAKRIYGDVIPSKSSNLRNTVIKKPVGVVAAITPWNFPTAMLTRKLAPALAAGCSVVVKPAAETPLSALALGALALEAGIPAGVINILPTTHSAEFGDQICSDPHVAKITFTGSTKVGKRLAEQSAPQLKRLSLELGGNAPFVVFADADIPLAVKGAVASKFRNAGQTCVCANRFYIESSIYDEFVEQLISAVAELKVGDGLADKVDIGPLINTKAVEKVKELVDGARSDGAQQIYQATLPDDLKGSYYPPTILSRVPHGSKILREEIFGPVISLVEFSTEEQAIALANNTPFGLAAYFYTGCRKRLARLPLKIHSGLLGLNTGLISNEMAPFGGVKESGWGREGSKYGMDDYLNITSITESFE